MRVAIIGGSGKMGTWLAEFLIKEGHQIMLLGRNRERLQAIGSRLGVETSDNPVEVKKADLVIFSVPIDVFEAVVTEYGPFITAGQNVIEITSVKTVPIAAMHQHLKTNNILGIHPMFGPGARDIAEHNFILTPTNATEDSLATRARQYIEGRGGKVSIMSPEEHDRTMAIVLGLPHILALVSADTLLQLGNFEQLEKLGGSTCKLLLMLADSVLTEDPELYAAIQTNIPGMSDLHKVLQKNLKEWSELVSHKDRQGFIARMQALRGLREKSDPEFGKAYDKMYRTLER
jgi:prephenate dehydrogenase